MRSLLLILSILATGPLAAQAGGQSTERGETAASLDEILVTARKRAESLQEVPLAITAYSAEQIEAIGVKTLEDIAVRTPGLQFNEQAGQIPGRYNCSIRFRGMNVNSEQPSLQLGALFIDGIFALSGCQSLGAEDLERVEVIKGPQAAYFGRNTFGGAVNYITRNPDTREFGGKLSASVAQKDEYEVYGGFEGPIIPDKLAFRVSGRYFDRGEIVDALVSGAQDYGEQMTRSAGLLLYATPVDALTIRWRTYYGEDRDGPAASAFISGNIFDTCLGTPGPAGNIRRRYICGEVPGVDDLPANILQHNTSLSPAALPPNFLQNAFVNNAVRDPAIAEALAIDFFGLKRNAFRTGLTADFELPNGWTLTGVAAYNELHSTWIRDFDLTLTESWWSTDPQNMEDRSYELRLASNEDGRFTWVGGVSLYEQEYTQSGNGGTAVTAFPVGGGMFIPLVFPNSLVNNDNVDTLGIFGGVTWDLNDQWSLSLEGRYQKDEVEKGQFIAAQAGLPVARQEWTDFLPRVIVQWQPTATTNLYANYAVGVLPGDINGEFVFGPDGTRTPAGIASIREQILNGTPPRPELGLPGGAAGLPQATDFIDREKLDSYEIGWKQQLMEGRMQFHAALYYMEWENQKGRVSVPAIDYNGNTQFALTPDNPAQCPAGAAAGQTATCNDILRTLQINLPGASELRGVELEGSWRVNRYLDVQAGLDYTDNEYTDFTFNFVELLAGTSDMRGNRSPRYPEWKGNLAANVTGPLGGSGMEWFTRWDYLYFGEYFVDESNLATAPEQQLVNARVGVRTDRLTAELWVRNLFDEDAWASASRWSDFSIPGNFNFPANQGIAVAPQVGRQFGVRFIYGF
jgi:iron complex outermembrane recepter protein